MAAILDDLNFLEGGGDDEDVDDEGEGRLLDLLVAVALPFAAGEWLFVTAAEDG